MDHYLFNYGQHIIGFMIPFERCLHSRNLRSTIRNLTNFPFNNSIKFSYLTLGFTSLRHHIRSFCLFDSCNLKKNQVVKIDLIGYYLLVVPYIHVPQVSLPSFHRKFQEIRNVQNPLSYKCTQVLSRQCLRPYGTIRRTCRLWRTERNRNYVISNPTTV